MIEVAINVEGLLESIMKSERKSKEKEEKWRRREKNEVGSS